MAGRRQRAAPFRVLAPLGWRRTAGRSALLPLPHLDEGHVVTRRRNALHEAAFLAALLVLLIVVSWVWR
jgi:hypothetical protein